MHRGAGLVVDIGAAEREAALVDAVETPGGARLGHERLHHAVLLDERDARVVGDGLGLGFARLQHEAVQRVLEERLALPAPGEVHHLGGELEDTRLSREAVARAARRVLLQHDDVGTSDRPCMLANRPGLHLRGGGREKKHGNAEALGHEYPPV